MLNKISQYRDYILSDLTRKIELKNICDKCYKEKKCDNCFKEDICNDKETKDRCWMYTKTEAEPLKCDLCGCKQ